MPNYRRWHEPGGSYFFTVVTHRRRPILTSPVARAILRTSIAAVRRDMPFQSNAWVLLADHLHAIWTLPPGDDAYSARWAKIKRLFTRDWLADGGEEGAMSKAATGARRRGVWQQRFWEHTLRDENDFNQHLDYVVYNPVRHGLSPCPHDWPWSSFHNLVRSGVYEATWSCGCSGGNRTPAFSRVSSHAEAGDPQ